YLEYPKVLSQPDAAPDVLIREALSQFLSRHRLRGDAVGISVPGQSGLIRFIKVPPAEEKKLADAVKSEARRQLPFNLDELVWDFQELSHGEAEAEVGLFAMKRDVVDRYFQHFQEVDMDVDVVQMAPLAVCNFIAFDVLGIGRKPRQARQQGC